MKLRTRVMSLLPVVALVASGCSSGPPGSGPLVLDAIGRVVVSTAGEDVVVDGEDRRIELGSVVEVVTGSATIRYPDGTSLELREGIGTAADTRIEAAETPRLLAGDLLVASGSEPFEVDAGTGKVELIAATAKVGRNLAFSTQVYDGSVAVQSGGNSLSVPALRQAVVPAARLVPRSPDPLAYIDADPWDRRFLGVAIETGEALQARALGFTAQLSPGEGRSPGFYRLLLPGLATEPGFGSALLEGSRSPGETLVGAAIAASAEAGGSFADTWRDVFRFRDQGAAWGLVAADHGVAGGDLVDDVDQAIGRAPLLDVATGSPPPSAPPSTAPPTTEVSSPTTTRPGRGGSSTTTPPTTEPPPEDDVLDEILDLLGADPDDSDGGLLGGLLG